jgi:basic membrane protein A and related proteins
MASRTRSNNLRRSILCGSLAALALAAGLVLPGGAAARQGSPFVVCLALDDGVGSALDPLAIAGLNEARRAGVTAHVRRSDMPAKDVATVRSCLATGASLTIGVGVLMENALDVVATANPDRRFAIVNAAVESLAHRPQNVTGVVFRAEQAGYLAGYAAGLWAKHHPVHGNHVVGSVGSISIPPVDSYLAGFEYGARRAYPKVTVVNEYTQNTLDPAKCRQRADDEIAKGASVVFAVAGPCSQGVFTAAQVAGIFAIGSDSEPTPSPAWLMTSAVKRADVAVLGAISAASAGTLRGGTDLVLGVRDGGVALGTWSPGLPTSIQAAVAAQARLLQAGKLQDIPVTL